MSAATVSSVSEVVSAIKLKLESQFQRVSVIGEVSNLRPSMAGHIYFNLSDQNSSISCVIFKSDALRNPEVKKIKDGDEIFCSGGLSVYNKKGTFQLVCRVIKAKGSGALMAQYEILKERLQKEGLFSLEAKKAIPPYADRIAVITSEHGAAVKDFIEVYSRRCLWMNLIIVPAVVQGKEAPKSLRKALLETLKYHQNHKPIDVIVMTRGGGSIEDLCAFNDEGLAYDVFNSPVPIVSAIGHERDYTILDYVADKRLETPSAAAEDLTKAQVLLKKELQVFQSYFNHWPLKRLSPIREKLNRLNPKIGVEKMKGEISLLIQRFKGLNLENAIDLSEKEIEVDELGERLVNGMKQNLEGLDKSLGQIEVNIKALSPKNVLERGYCFLSQDDDVVPSFSEFERCPEENFEIHFHDGTANVRKS
ncbi:MAG: exodeoxyribonuclease VII large subunit [Bacteriovoracaceae bacterium]